MCKEIDYRQRGIHPAERCVRCYTKRDTRSSSLGNNDRHMKTEGRKPSPKLSACRTAVVKDSRRRKLQPHCEMEDDDCRVTLAASREVCDKPNEFPFFHADARQPKVGRFRLACACSMTDNSVLFVVSVLFVHQVRTVLRRQHVVKSRDMAGKGGAEARRKNTHDFDALVPRFSFPFIFLTLKGCPRPSPPTGCPAEENQRQVRGASQVRVVVSLLPTAIIASFPASCRTNLQVANETKENTRLGCAAVK